MRSLQKPFSTYLRIIGYQPNTRKMMEYALSELLSRVEKPVKEVSRKDIVAHANYLAHRPNKKYSGGLSSSMLRHYLYGLKVFFSWCEQTGKIEMNPMSGYALPKVETPARQLLSEREIKELYEVCDHNLDRAILGLFYGCGLRSSEGEKLNGKDVSFKEKVVYVRKGKGGKRRVVPMSDRVSKHLRAYYRNDRQGSDQDAFLENTRGRRLRGSSINKRLKKLLSKSGITKRITLHNLRHSIATHLLSSGVSLEQVRDFLGHAYLETTQIYTHYDPQNLP